MGGENSKPRLLVSRHPTAKSTKYIQMRVIIKITKKKLSVRIPQKFHKYYIELSIPKKVFHLKKQHNT